ncbi:hypothetical protein [Streptomyces sp. NPDC004728]|uniref:hypothetical protein n=1 Tax=Streptomyces sp. NPDC004728 TaxID=3154289 RepID=UPI0033B6FA39
MKPEQDLLDTLASAREQARSLRGWNSGPERIYDLLRTATKLRAMEISAGVTTDLPWESVLAQLVVWHHDRPFGTGTCSERDAAAIVLAAAAAQRLDLLEAGMRSGAYQVRMTRGDFRVRHRWDASAEVADMLLEHDARPTRVPELSAVERQWISTRPVDSRSGPPPEVLHAAVQRAAATIEVYRQSVPEGQVPDAFPLGEGMTAGDMISVLAVIMGIASLSEQTAHRLSRLEATLVHMPASQLMAVIAEMCPNVPEVHQALVVERLTYRSGRSCRTSPLIRHGDVVIICPPLVTPRAVDPIMLRSAAHDSRGFGRVGREQGERATAWATWLHATPGTLVAERVPATRPDGRSAGDLDVIIVDPVRCLGLCLEIKWPIEAVSLHEVMKVENWINSAAEQLNRLRGELRASTATAQLPPGWPPFDAIDWTWCVGTPQQLSTRPLPVPDMHATSLRYVQALGTPPDLNALVTALTRPDLPTKGVHFDVMKRSFPVGRRQVHLDALQVRTTCWRPRFG